MKNEYITKKTIVNREVKESDADGNVKVRVVPEERTENVLDVKFHSIECNNITLRSPNKKHEVVLSVTDQGGGIYVSNNDNKTLISLTSDNGNSVCLALFGKDHSYPTLAISNHDDDHQDTAVIQLINNKHRRDNHTNWVRFIGYDDLDRIGIGQ